MLTKSIAAYTAYRWKLSSYHHHHQRMKLNYISSRLPDDQLKPLYALMHISVCDRIAKSTEFVLKRLDYLYGGDKKAMFVGQVLDK